MATGDRETTLILRAADLSSQTIEKVLATAAKLLAFQETLNAKVASGTVKVSEFNGSLNNILQVFTALAQMKLVFPETERLERSVAAQQARVEALKARAAEIQAIPEDERSRKQQSQLDRFTSPDLTAAGNPKGTIAAAEQRLDLTTARLQRNLDLERAMGVTEENRVALQAQINAGLERHTQELLRARNAQLEIIEANLRERDAQAELKRAAEEIGATHRRALVDIKAQEAALRELTSEANAFDKALAKAFDDAVKASDRLKGEQFTRDFGDAAFEKAKREKEAADQITIAQGEAAHEDQQRKRRAQEAEALETSRRRAQLAQTQLPQIQEVAPAPQFDALTRGLREIVSPADAARQTINGLLLETVKLAEATRLSGQSIAQYREILRSLEAAYRDIRGQAGLIDTYRQQTAAREAAGAAMQRERAALAELVASYSDATKADAELDRGIKAQEGVAARAVNEFNRLGRAVSETQGQLRAAGIDFNDLTGSEKKLEAASGVLAAALGTVRDEILKTQKAAASGSKDELTKFLEDGRRKAADFRATLPPVQAFGEAAPGASGLSKTTETVAAIEAIRDPAAAARQTFVGLQEEIAKTNAAFEASPKRIQDASIATESLSAAFNDLRRQAGVFDLFRQSEAETVRLTHVMQEAVQKLNALEREQASSTTVDENLTRAIKAQRVEVTSSISSYNAANASFAKFKEAAKAAGLETGDTTAQLRAFGETATLVSGRLDALDKITGRSTKSQPVLFGLRGYELQNLGYQINDVVTGFASGQQALQILAQQGGQIFQIWERDIGTALYNLRRMPLAIAGIGGAAVAAVISVISLVNALDRAAAERKIGVNIALSADQGANTAKGLNEAALAASHLGASYEEAVKGAIELEKHGFSDAQAKQLLAYSQQLARVTGKPLSEPLKAVMDLLHGSADDVRKFSQEWVGLEVNQRRALEDAVSGGRSAEAQTLLLAATGPKLQGAFDKSFSEVGKAWRDLGNKFTGGEHGWGDFWDRMASYPLKWARAIIEAGESVRKAIDRLGNPAPSEFQFGAAPRVGQTGGGSPAGGRAAGSAYQFPGEGFATALSRRENPSGDPREQNRQGFVGNYQYGSERLHDVLFDGQPAYTPPAGGEARNAFKGAFNIPGFAGVKTLDDFKNSAAAQQAVFVQDYKQVQQLIEKLDPSRIFDQEGLHALAHLGGTGAMERFIKSGGKGADTADANGTRPIDYYREFSRGQPGTTPAVTPGAGGGAAAPNRPNAQVLADEEFRRKESERNYQQTLQTGTAQQKEDAFIAHLAKVEQDIRKDVATQAQQPGSAQPNETEVKAAIDRAQELATREYLRTLTEQAVEITNFRREIAQRELNVDKTNLQNRLDVNKAVLNEAQQRADLLKQKPGGLQEAGVTAQQLDETISKARVDADNRTRAEVAAAIWDKFNAEQKAALDVYGNNIKHGIDVAGNLEKARQEVASRAGAREEARQKAVDTLQGVPGVPGVPDTAETRALRARIESQAAIAARPPDLKQFTQEAAQQTAQPVEEQFKALEETMTGLGLSVQRGAKPFSEALQEATSTVQQRLPELTRATNDAVAGLQRLIDGGATPAQVEEYKLKQQQLLTRLQQAPKDILLFINAGLEDQQKELESLVKRFKDLMAQAVQLQTRGQFAAAQDAVAKANELLPQIGQARDKLVSNARQGATAPGLRPGEVASLNEQADKAEKEADPQQLRIQGILDEAKGAETQIRQFQTSLREHQATEQQLLVKGLTTQSSYEAEMKRTYEETSAQAQPAIDRLLKLADAAEAAGASASKVAQLRDQAKLLAAELAYVPPLTQQIMLGFEQAFVSRGEQAFDSIAKAIGTAAVEGGKLNDVWIAVRNGFANMAAGILQDVAKIIIKYELLKIVKDALGVDPGAAGGAGSGGGGGGTGGVGGLAGALISALGGGGGAAGAASTFGAAGVEAGAATGADAGIASLGFLLHGGGIVGSPVNMSRPVDLSIFDEAQRMHAGGVVGLPSHEVPMILEKNEEVLAKNDPRNRLNQGKGPQPTEGAGTSIRNVLAVGDREIAQAMNSSHGERVFLNFLQRNAPTVKKYLG